MDVGGCGRVCQGSGAMVTEQDHSGARDAKMKPLSGPSEAQRTKEGHIQNIQAYCCVVRRRSPVHVHWSIRRLLLARRLQQHRVS